MIIGRMFSPVHSLGPGERIALWTQGCKKGCDGCMSLDLQPKQGIAVNEEKLAKIVIQLAQKNNCNGITISGGDPFEQAEALCLLLRQIREYFADILVYTGYTLEEIRNGIAGNLAIECLGMIDVLIDGRYVKSKNEPDCILRGSKNQKIHFFNSKLRDKYEEYMKKGRMVETFEHNDEIILVGILNKEEHE